MKGVEGKLYPDKSAVPKLFKARSVPYAMKDKVGEELLRLKEEGIIEEVTKFVVGNTHCTDIEEGWDSEDMWRL